MEGKPEKAKKQIIVDPDLYNKIKGKMASIGKTVSEWFEEQARKEVYKPYE